LIGPVPIANKINATKNVVKLESRMAQVDERVAARKRRYVQKFKKAEKKYRS